jgi:chemotaxis protein methyltransferase CheR
VFCRNVLIYFSPEHVTAFLTRLAEALPRGACLFLGYAETIWQVTDLFEPIRIGDAFEYHRRRDTPTGSARAPTPPLEANATLAVRTAPGPPRPARKPAATPVLARQAAGPGLASEASALVEAGQAATAGGDHLAAIGAFRRYAYLEPDQPIAHLHLGLALEAAGDGASARRAYRAARSALGRSDAAAVESGLGGYRVEELIRLLDSKQDNEQEGRHP